MINKTTRLRVIMSTHRFCMAFAILLLCEASYAQDVITKQNGESIISKVIEIRSDEIKFKKFSNQDGPLYVMPIKEVLSITFENGEVERFDTPKSDISPSGNQKASLDDPVSQDNALLIQRYNKAHHYLPTEKEKKKAQRNRIEGGNLYFWGVTNSSVLKTSMIEIELRRNIESPYGLDWLGMDIIIKNLTDNFIYLDLGNSFNVHNTGHFESFYSDKATSVSTTEGSISTNPIGIGDIALSLGLGITATSQSSIQTSSSTTHFSKKNRYISIPPKGKHYIWDLVSVVVAPEITIDNLHRHYLGEETYYNEDNSIDISNYYFTYSSTSDFSSYKTVSFSLFVSEVIGCGNHEEKEMIDRVTPNDDSTLFTNTLHRLK